MAYKLKPNKSVMSRFKITKTGKLKRHHAKTSHLMSAKSSKTRRRLGRSGIVSESLAGNLRKMMCVQRLNPKKAAHEKALAAKKAAKAEPAK